MQVACLLVQLPDGFKTASDNVKELLPEIISKADLEQINETRFLNTILGTFSFYGAQKSN